LPGRYRPAGFAGPATAACCALTDSARSQKTDRTFMYKLWAPLRRRTGQLAVLAEPGQRVPVDAAPRGNGPACAASRLPAPAHAEDRRSQISGDLRARERPRERPPPPSSPMHLSGLAYHRRDNLPGQIRAQIRPPGPSAKITQGARPLRQEPLPCNLTR
jgi:hypothetical protein